MSGRGNRDIDRKGKGIALSNEERDVVVSSNRGVGDVGSSRGGGRREISSNIAEGGVMTGTTNLVRHCFGDVSTAVIQGNRALEDFSQVELGRTATFVGIYDGHGGSQAASFVSRTMTKELMRRIRDTRTMSAIHLREAFLGTEAAWKRKVVEQFEADNSFAAYGTCCLVGVFWRRTLYLANAGDSRAVIARAKVDSAAEIVAVPLTRDDNVNDDVVRAEVLAQHHDETDFVVEDAKGVFRIKGKIQVSKSIGDEYLKSARFNLDHIPRFKLNSPVRDDNPALSANPTIYTIPIGPRDRFMIFASDGLWENMSNEEAVRIVQEFPREGIAERLVIEALNTASTRIGGTYDDISVVVIYFDDLEADIHERFPLGSILQGSVSSEAKTKLIELDELALADLSLGTIYLQNLPYGTRLPVLYPRLIRYGPIHYVVFGANGFCCQVIYYSPEDAINFVNFNRNCLILSGKLMSISFIWERHHRHVFRIVHYHCTVQEVHFTLRVSNLATGCTVSSITQFFNGHGLNLRNHPIMHVMHNGGHLYAFVSFVDDEESRLALDLDGALHLGLPINIDRSEVPQRIPRGYHSYLHLL